MEITRLGRAFVVLDSETLLVSTALPGASHNNLFPPVRQRDIAVCHFLKSEIKCVSLSAERANAKEGGRDGIHLLLCAIHFSTPVNS